MSFGERLRKLRKNEDLTQEQIAKDLNIVRSTYAYYEIGRTYPDFSTLIRIAQLFNVSTDFLLLGYETKVPILHDDSSVNYKYSDDNAIKDSFALSENEQKLLLLFRALGKDSQAIVLEKLSEEAEK